MSTITISRQLGSLGTEIAREVAEKLNYEYVDKENIGKVLADYGFGALEVERFDEKKPSSWDFFSLQKTKFLYSIRAAIYDFAQKGQAVIVGRGGQVLLKNLPGILHIRIFAPFDLRVKRLMESQKIDESQAGRMLRQSERDSDGYMHSFFHVDWNDASLYDLLINTERISLNTAVQLIFESIKPREVQEGLDKGKEKLAELALVQKAEAKLITKLGYVPRPVEIRAEKGVIFLRGTVSSSTLREECERVIAALEGVDHVENELSVAEHYPYSA